MSKARDLANFSDVAPDIGRKNIIINGGFQVSQRGDFTTASSSTNGAYFVDRWLSAQDVITADKQHLYNQTITSDITAHTLKIIATSSGTGNFQLSQPIERVNQELGNKTLTYSVWVKTNNSNVRLRGIFDDSGWTQFDAVHTGDGTWQKLSTTFTTGPTRSAGHYQVQVLAFNNGNVSITSGDYIEIAQPQLEIGSVATPFEHRSYGEELLACCRYYWKVTQPQTGNNESICMGTYYSNTQLNGHTPFKVPMRTSPTLVVSSGTSHFIAFRNAGSDAFDTFNPGETTENGGDFSINSGVSGTAGHGATICTASSSASFAWNAEL